MSEKKLDRRDFVKILAVGTGLTTGYQLLGKPNQSSASSSASEGGRSWAMVIDQSKCIGCRNCFRACNATNDTNPEIEYITFYNIENNHDEDTFLPVACMHCVHAPCVSVCPVGATYYREDGIVMMDNDLCIGCRYCQAACPYQARSFNWEEFTGDNPYVPDWGEPDVERRPRGVPEKCTFCYQRIDRGLSLGLTPGIDPAATPACVNSCPVEGARVFGDLNDPNSPASILLAENNNYQLLETMNTGPRIYYLPDNRS